MIFTLKHRAIIQSKARHDIDSYMHLELGIKIPNDKLFPFSFQIILKSPEAKRLFFSFCLFSCKRDYVKNKEKKKRKLDIFQKKKAPLITFMRCIIYL